MNCRVICSFVVCAAVAQSAFGITLSPSGDTFGYQFLPAMNLSAPTPGFGSLLPAGATTTGHDTKSVLSFDLSSVGLTGSQVQSASLNLFVVDTATTGFGASPSPGSPITVNLAPLSASFDESTATWNTITAGGAGPVETSLEISGINQTVSFNVTDLVKDWLDGSLANNGVLLTGDAPVGGSPNWVYAVFSSASGGVAPELVITPVPEPATLLLAMVSAPALVFAAIRRLSRRTA
jgi:hypothetical protein